MAVLVRWCLVMAAALSGGSLGSVRLDAQGIAAPELTAAFLINFVKFTTWPSAVLHDGGPIIVCVSGDDWVANSLADLTRNQRVDGHPLWVRRANLDQPLDDCHVVYGAALDANRAQRLIQSVSGRSILTVSDVSDFAQRGGWQTSSSMAAGCGLP